MLLKYIEAKYFYLLHQVRSGFCCAYYIQEDKYCEGARTFFALLPEKGNAL